MSRHNFEFFDFFKLISHGNAQFALEGSTKRSCDRDFSLAIKFGPLLADKVTIDTLTEKAYTCCSYNIYVCVCLSLHVYIYIINTNALKLGKEDTKTFPTI